MAEDALNFTDSATVTWSIVNDVANGRYNIRATAAAPPPPPYIPPTDQEALFSQTATLIPNGGVDQLSWHKGGRATLLDLTNPQNPAFLTSGIYAVQAFVYPESNMTLGGQYIFDLNVWTGALGFTSQVQTSPPATAAIPAPKVGLTVVTHVDVPGGYIQALITNKDGGASIPFGIFDAYVQKIT